MSDEVAQVLRDALARLDSGKRWRKDFATGKGRMCAEMALRTAAYAAQVSEDPALSAVEAVARTEYPDRVRGWGRYPVITLNDHPDTTWPDVERVFEKAIANAEAEL